MLLELKQIQLFLHNGLNNSYLGLLDKDIGFILNLKILDKYCRLLTKNTKKADVYNIYQKERLMIIHKLQMKLLMQVMYTCLCKGKQKL